MLKEIEGILKNNKNVIDFELDEEDGVANLDYLITFENKNAKEVIKDLEIELEEKVDGISVKTLFEQIDDQVDEGGCFVTVDFYILE